MSTLTYILVIAACALIAFWLVMAASFGIGQFWHRRASFNANFESVARRFGEDFTPVSRTRWLWIAIQSIPLLLIGAALLTAHFFISLLICGWYWITGRPMPQPERLEEINDDQA